MTSHHDTSNHGTPRKNISKRARYEVLNRDSFTCQYCGLKAPHTELHVDHVIPVALGGDNKPSNLVAACKDCNAGKGAANPDSDLVERLSAEAATYALEMANKGATIAQRLRDESAAVAAFDSIWENWTFAGTHAPRPDDYRESVRRWHRQSVPVELIEYAVDAAMRATNVKMSNIFRYMAGVIYGTLKQEDVSSTLGDKHITLYTEAEYEAHGDEMYQMGAKDWTNTTEDRLHYTDPVARHIDKQAGVGRYQNWDGNCARWDAEAEARWVA